MTTSSLEATAEAAVPPRKVLLAAIASSFGWALDLFDLFILLYVAPVVGRLFFPSEHPTLSLAAVYASFAVSLLVRPLGSAVFGAYADKHGRKRAMMIAMIGVGLSTAVFGALPTIHQIGFAAPIIFLLLRIVQGMFVGGIVASTHTIGTESIAPRYRGLLSGIIGGSGAGCGALLASFAYFVLSAIFPGDAFDQWGWRFMFFSGIISMIFGIVIFRYLEETPIWKRLQKRQQAAGQVPVDSPLKRLFSTHRNILLINLLITFGGGASYYITVGYLPTLLEVVVGTPHEAASRVLVIASIVSVITSPLFGALSDWIGRKKTFMCLGVLNLVCLPMLFLAMPHASGQGSTILYASCIAILGAGGTAPILIFLNERFPTALRASGTGLSWNIGFALGGTMPTFVSLVSASPTDIPIALTAFGIVLSVIYLIGAAVIPETRGEFD